MSLQILDGYGISTTSEFRAVQEVGEMVREGKINPRFLISDLADVSEEDFFDLSPDRLRIIGNYLVQDCFNEDYDRTVAFRKAYDDAQSLTEKHPYIDNATNTSVSSVANESVEPKSSKRVRKPRNGEKVQDKVNRLYKEHIINAGMSRKEFIDLLVNAEGILQSSAQVYTSVAKKNFKE